MGARRWAAVLATALAAVFAAGAEAPAQWVLEGACPPGASAQACYREGLTLALQALPRRTPGAGGMVRALAMLHDACGRGLGSACYMAALMIETDTTAFTGPSGEGFGWRGAFLARGCAAGQPSGAACNAMATAYGRTAEKSDSALHLLRRGCDLGHGTACVQAAGQVTDWPDAGARTGSLPVLLERSACERGSPAGCAQAARRARDRLARARQAGRGGPAYRQALREVRRAFLDACEQRLPTACTDLGATFLDGAHTDSALYYFGLACSGARRIWGDDRPELGDGRACAEIGRLRLRAAASRDDSAAALEPLRQGCTLVDAEACADLAYHGYQVRSVPRHAAVQGAVTACYEKSGYGCWVASWLYGQGELYDTAQSSLYLRRACRLGYGAACTQALGLLQTDEDARNHAYKLLRRACTLRDGQGCAMYGFLLAEEGEEHVFPYLSRACEYGLAEACAALVQMPRDPPDRVAEGRYRSRACRLDRSFCKQKY